MDMNQVIQWLSGDAKWLVLSVLFYLALRKGELVMGREFLALRVDRDMWRDKCRTLEDRVAQAIQAAEASAITTGQAVEQVATRPARRGGP